MSIDLRRVHYFLTLCDTFNFSEASRALGISQPALTKALIRLEEELGSKLLRREGKHTHLTPFGNAMKQQFRELDDAADRARIHAAQLLRGQFARIQIAIMCSVGPARLAYTLSVYRNRYPDVDIHLYDADSESLNEMLLSGSVDCGLVSTSLNDQDKLRCTRLYEESLKIVHPQDHPFARLNSLSMSDLRSEHILNESSLKTFQDVEEIQEPDQPSANCVVRSVREDWMQLLVKAGFGLAIVTEDTPVEAGLAATPVCPESLVQQVSLVVPHGRSDNPVVCRFIECMESCLQESNACVAV